MFLAERVLPGCEMTASLGCCWPCFFFPPSSSDAIDPSAVSPVERSEATSVPHVGIFMFLSPRLQSCALELGKAFHPGVNRTQRLAEQSVLYLEIRPFLPRGSRGPWSCAGSWGSSAVIRVLWPRARPSPPPWQKAAPAAQELRSPQDLRPIFNWICSVTIMCHVKFCLISSWHYFRHLLGMTAFVRGHLVVSLCLWCLSMSRSPGEALSEIRLGIKVLHPLWLLEFPLCWCVCTSPSEVSVLHAALQSSARSLLSSAFQHEHSTFVNVIGKIAPAVPGSCVLFAFPITKRAYHFFFLYFLILVEIKISLFSDELKKNYV